MRKTIYIIPVCLLIAVSIGIISYLIIKKNTDSSQGERANTQIASGEVVEAEVSKIVLNKNGFEPNSLEIEKATVIEFINNSSSDVTIESTGTNKIPVGKIKAGETLRSLPLFETGTYEFGVLGDDSVRGRVVVK